MCLHSPAVFSITLHGIHCSMVCNTDTKHYCRLSVTPRAVHSALDLFFQVFCVIFVLRSCTATQYDKRDNIVYWGECVLASFLTFSLIVIIKLREDVTKTKNIKMSLILLSSHSPLLTLSTCYKLCVQNV